MVTAKKAAAYLGVESEVNPLLESRHNYLERTEEAGFTGKERIDEAGSRGHTWIQEEV